jgi:hypothetical protein
MPPVVTTSSQVQCTHGGMAVLVTTESVLMAGGAPVLIESDMPIIAGCPFVVGIVPSPCITIEWVTVATQLTVNGAGVVLETSIGTCLNAAGAPQGVAIISGGSPMLEAI